MLINYKKSRSFHQSGFTHFSKLADDRLFDYYSIDYLLRKALFSSRRSNKMQCKMSCIPVRLCEFPVKKLVLSVVYGFAALEQPMLLLLNLKIREKNKQSELEDLGVVTIQSIRNLNLLATLAAGYIGLTITENKRVFSL